MEESAGSESDPAVAILCDPDLGITPKAAAEFAGNDPAWVLAHALAYLDDHNRGKANGTGALLHRLRMGWVPAAIRDTDRKSDLYRRHGPSETDDRKRYRPLEYAEIING